MIEDSDLAYCLRQVLEEMLQGERTIKMYRQQADFLAVLIQIIHRLLNRLADRSHRNDDAVRILGTIIIKQMVLAAGDFCHLRHCLFHQLRQRMVILIGCLALLEIHIRILSRTTDDRMIRVQCAAAELLNSIPVKNLRKILIVHHFDFLDFMRRAESIKEINERNAAFNSDKMRYGRKIHNFLNACFRQHCAACLPRSHNILMIAKNIQGVRSQSTGADMEHARKQFAGHLVKIRNHQQEALRCRVRRGEGSCLQRTMYSSCSTCFRFHLDHANLLAEEVFLSMCRHLIHMLSHRRRRRNRINSRDIRKSIGDIGGSGIAVHGFHLFAHVLFCSPLNEIQENTLERTSKVNRSM